MKKLYLSASIAIAALAFTSCEADKEPVYQAPDPATFVLNIPPMANQLYILAEGTTVDLTTSQPDYGVATITNYSVDVTLDDDFIEATDAQEANYKTITPKNPTQAKISLDAAVLDEAICQLKGITAFVEYPEAGLDPVKVTMRAHAWISGVESSECVSNNITLEAVQLYNPFPEVPGFVYFVGSPSGWAEPNEANAGTYAEWSIEETGVGTKIYIGSVNIPAGEQYFRFYSKLAGWDAPGVSIGSSDNPDHNEKVSFSSSATPLNPTLGKGNWLTDASWTGGEVTFEINLTDPAAPKVTAKQGKYAKEAYVYLVGSMAGWAEPNADNASTYDNWKLVDSGETGVYTNTFDIPAGELFFRVYPELTGWGVTPYASDNGGENLTMTLGNPYKCANGEGCWTFNWDGGKLTFTLDTKAEPATLTVKAAAE